MIKEISVNREPNVKTLIEAYRKLMDNLLRREYNVDPRRSIVEVGDTVRPETTIGFQVNSECPVSAGLKGLVVRISLNPRDESRLTLVLQGK